VRPILFPKDIAMLVAPPPGRKYRDTVTRALVPDEGFEADPNDLDIARALACGDLVELDAAAAAEAAPTARKAVPATLAEPKE
jgi:hypothetical protein